MGGLDGAEREVRSNGVPSSKWEEPLTARSGLDHHLPEPAIGRKSAANRVPSAWGAPWRHALAGNDRDDDPWRVVIVDYLSDHVSAF